MPYSAVSGVKRVHVVKGVHRSGKSQGEISFLKVREKSVNFEISQ